jgi:mannosyltransferase
MGGADETHRLADATRMQVAMTSHAVAARSIGDVVADASQRGNRAAWAFTGLRRILVSVWLWPAVLVGVLGLYRIGRPELWRDELASWSAASRNLGELFRLLGHVDASNGAYYLLLHGWISVFGDSAAMLRLPSLIAMCLAASCVALCGRRIFGRRAGLTAGLLFALIPSVSRFAQEARAYSFAVLGVAVATLLLVRALQQPARWVWFAYAGSVAFVGLAHLVALAFLVGHIAGAAIYQRRRTEARVSGRLALAILAGLLPVLPVVIVARKQVQAQVNWIPRPYLVDLIGSGQLCSVPPSPPSPWQYSPRWRGHATAARPRA